MVDENYDTYSFASDHNVIYADFEVVLNSPEVKSCRKVFRKFISVENTQALFEYVEHEFEELPALVVSPYQATVS